MSEASNNPASVDEKTFTTPDVTATFLSSITNQQVNVKLFNDLLYTGELSSIDGYMNVVLLNANEIADGKVTTTYEEVFLRGNNVIYIGMA
jgi:U6 snRNA-associated Sm-like protein LSm6